MESSKSEEEMKEKELNEQSSKKDKYKILKNKYQHYLLNIVSDLIYNKNNFEEKIKPNDLEFNLVLDSNYATYRQIKYNIRLIYNSFNPKRDLLKNNKLYKSFPEKLDIIDEYYKDDFDDIPLYLSPKIQKGIHLDLSEFPLYSYNNKVLDNNIKDEIKKDLDLKEKEYALCIYLSIFEDVDNDFIRLVDGVVSTPSYDKCFKSTYIIIQAKDEKQSVSYAKDEILKKYLNKNDEPDNDKTKIKILFNLISEYQENEKNGNNFINIFEDIGGDYKYLSNEKNYFFILDHNKNIIKLKPLKSLEKTVSLCLTRFNENPENLNFSKYTKEEKEQKINECRKLINFVSNIKKQNLNYIFDIKFKINFSLKINDEMTKLNLSKINKLYISGQFFTKEYKYLKQICDSIDSEKCEYSLTELPTIDIEIDFTNMDCKKCKKKILEEEYLYYCYICKEKYCFSCVQNQLRNNKGKKKYIDNQHNLIFFKTRDKNQFLNIEKTKLGKNIFAEYRDDNLGCWKFHAICNGCRGQLREGQERYLCLHCRKGKRMSGGYIDFCSDCIKKMCENKNDMINLERKSDETLNYWNNDFLKGFEFKVEHKHDHHVYLLLPLAVDSVCEPYYEF